MRGGKKRTWGKLCRADLSRAGYCCMVGNGQVREGREGWRREGKSRKGRGRAGWIRAGKGREGKGRTGKGESVPGNTEKLTNRKTVLSACWGGDFSDRGSKSTLGVWSV